MSISIKISNVVRYIAVATTSACVFLSCAQVDEPQDGAVGYLAAPMLEIVVDVQDLTQTKVLEGVVQAPAVSDINFIVKDKDGNIKYNNAGLWDGGLVMPVGAYTIEATYGSNSFDTPYFVGTASGSIEPLDQETPSLTMSLGNSLIWVELDEEFTKHFTTSSDKVTLSSGSSNSETAFKTWHYIPSGTSLTATISGKSSTGEDVSFDHILANPSAEVAYKLICKSTSSNWPSINLPALDASNIWVSRAYITSPATFTGNISDDNKAKVVYEAIVASSSDWSSPVTAVIEDGVYVLKGLTPDTDYKVRARVGALISNEVNIKPSLDGLTISLEHTSTSGDLDGTDVKITCSKSDLIKSRISNWAISLCNSDGSKTLRPGLSLGNSDGSLLTDANAWPFLPKGSYKLVVAGDQVSASLDCSVGDPAFNVTASGYTTYDKYLDYKAGKATLAEANQEGKAEYIFQISSSVGITENLLKNNNYGTTKVYYSCGPYTDYECDFVNGAGDSDNAVRINNIGNVGGFSWGSNSLTARVVFAGTSITSPSHTCHITGLPYITSPMIESDWSFASWNCEYSNGTIKLGGVSGSGEASATSQMSFHIPSDIGIKVNTNVTIRAYKFGLYYNTDFTVSVNGNQIIKQNSQGQDNNNTGKNYNLSGTSTFNPTGYSLKLNSSYTAAGPWSKVHSIQILYN